jgi:thioredoxin 1
VIGPVDAAGFQEHALAADAALVDFWAKWCKPCEAIEPHLEAVASAHGIPLVKVDIDTQPGIASRYGVLSLPTVVLLVGGEPRETVYGAQPRARYEQAVAAHVTAN